MEYEVPISLPVLSALVSTVPYRDLIQLYRTRQELHNIFNQPEILTTVANIHNIFPIPSSFPLLAKEIDNKTRLETFIPLLPYDCQEDLSDRSSSLDQLNYLFKYLCITKRADVFERYYDVLVAFYEQLIDGVELDDYCYEIWKTLKDLSRANDVETYGIHFKAMREALEEKLDKIILYYKDGRDNGYWLGSDLGSMIASPFCYWKTTGDKAPYISFLSFLELEDFLEYEQISEEDIEVRVFIGALGESIEYLLLLTEDELEEFREDIEGFDGIDTDSPAALFVKGEMTSDEALQVNIGYSLNC